MALHVYTGPMFSGKTSHLVRTLNDVPSKRVLLIRHDYDKSRSGDNPRKVYTHKGVEDMTCDVVWTSCLQEVDVTGIDVIGIDEGQFFEALPKTVMGWLKDGKDVHVCSLDSDLHREPFGEVHKLLHISTTFRKFQGKCAYCENPSSFTRRTSPNPDLILIGGSSEYEPVCHLHWT